ncbi:MAG: hypothetical protein Q8J78_05970 [Moraxellaceae bacterium]|nr:hypothetical protein [Moraxellaceae bacterium]
MHGLDRYAERLKLEGLLQATPGSLAFVEQLDASRLREMRLAIRARFFDRHHDRFARIAAASHLLPVSLSALIARKGLGPLLSARATAHLPPGNAIAMARHEPVGFLTDVCIHTDPRRVLPMLAGMPVATVIAVATELAARGDAPTMGEMVAGLPVAAIEAVLEALHDNDALLLQVSLFIDDDTVLRQLADLISDERASRMMQAADAACFWPVALYLMQRLDAPRRARFGDGLSCQSDALLNNLVRSIHQHQLWHAALPILADLSKVSRGRLALTATVHEPDVMSAIVGAAEAHDLWPSLLMLLPLLDEGTQLTLLELPALQQPATLARILHAADANNRWADLLPLLNLMETDTLVLMATVGAALDDRAVLNLMQAAHQHRLWTPGLRLTGALPLAQQRRAGCLLAQAGPSMLEGLLRHVATTRQWELLTRWHEAQEVDIQRQLLMQACRAGDAQLAQWLDALVQAGLNTRYLESLRLTDGATHERVAAAIRRLPEDRQPELLAQLAAVTPVH